MTPISSISPISLNTESPVSAVQGGATTAKAFGAYVADAVASSINTIQDGESAMINGLTGKAGAQDVVNAVIAAETTLQTVVALRDKAISAYNDILRMPV